MGASPGGLTYASLNSLIELKLAAGRLRDQADVVELLRENQDSVNALREHVKQVHSDYAQQLEELLVKADLAQ